MVGAPEPDIVRGAGVLLLCPATGRILLLRRTDAGTLWCFPGGKIEEGEAPADAARRETEEESGYHVPGDLIPWTRRLKDGVDFTTFVAKVPDEFVPALSEEHDLARWATVDEALSDPGLHPGCRIALIYDQLDELGIARAMRVGELVSPQRYQNLLLVALRVTGTGASYRSRAGRKKLGEDGKELKGPDGEPVFEGEYVWRDPSHYLTEEFLQRCQGLPVIWEHSPRMLTGEEFTKRAVGTVMLPYLQGTEVWGIAKIYDEPAAHLLETEQLSTSPGVRVTGPKVPTEDGKVLLIEDDPTLLDHVAICEVGVWDKGGPPAGVLNQSTAGEAPMPKYTLDDIGAHLERLHGKMDDMTSRQDRQDARLDAMDPAKEQERKDAEEKEKALKAEQERKDAEAKAEQEKKDAEEKERRDAMTEEERKDAEKKDAEEKERKDAEAKAEQEKKDAEDKARHDAEEKERMDSETLNRRLAALEVAAAPLSPEQQREFTTIQAQADRAYQAFDSAAPRNLPGETPLAYRKRLLREHLPKSPTWKGTDLDHINDSGALGVIERQVYADALTAARNPAPGGGAPRLVKQTTVNDAGIRMVEFYGDAEACWAPFKSASRYITRFEKNPGQTK